MTQKLQMLVDKLNKYPEKFMDGKYDRFELRIPNYHTKIKSDIHAFINGNYEKLYTLDSRSFVRACYEYLGSLNPMSPTYFKYEIEKSISLTDEEIIDDLLTLADTFMDNNFKPLKKGKDAIDRSIEFMEAEEKYIKTMKNFMDNKVLDRSGKVEYDPSCEKCRTLRIWGLSTYHDTLHSQL